MRFLILIGVLFITDALAGAKTVGPTKGYTKEQQIRRGEIEKPKMTTCRLKKRVIAKNGQQVCVYEGGNKTFEMMVERWCPKQYSCVYAPNSKEPNIDSVVDSLNSIKN